MRKLFIAFFILIWALPSSAFSPAIQAVLGQGAAAASTTTFGLDSGDGTDAFALANYVFGMRFQCTQTGTLTKLEVLFDDATPNGNARLGVYSDNEGVPNSLLVDAGEVAVANGFVSISGLSQAVTSGTYYWLSFDMASSNGVKTQSATGANTIAFAAQAYGALPASFPSPSYNTFQYVMRATVTY